MKNFYAVGDNVDVVESALVHPAVADNLVNSGDPVCVGVLVGVCNFDAAAATDVMVVSTRGIFSLAVTATDQNGNSAVVFGDKLYIDGATAVITKDSTKTPFGIALGAVDAGATGTIKVKLQAAGEAGTQMAEQDVVTAKVGNGAIAIAAGTVTLGSGGALAMTLAAPAAADNGKKIRIIAVTAKAHVVTTPQNKVITKDGTYDTITFQGAIGEYIILEALNQTWQVIGVSGPVLTEV